MRVAFLYSALCDESSFHHIDQIIYEIERGIHDWHIDDPEMVETSPWLVNARHTYRTLFEKAATRPVARQSSHRLHEVLLVVSQEDIPGSLCPATAVKYIREPLKILMENENSDSLFLDAVLSVMADPEVMRLKELKALVYRGSGGNTELVKLVNNVYADAKNNGMPVRAVVFTDGDGFALKKKYRHAL